jgi:hypothetical protein
VEEGFACESNSDLSHQIEYYFSVQNLAMDFFLRQQMDSEGWIDTAMIASFNRIKQMVTDVALVTEVMTMSSLLEVKDDKVRLSGGAAKRWVLPDAKPSKFEASPAYNPSPKKAAGEGTEVSHGIPASMDASALGLEDLDLLMPTSPQPKFDVENALMKSSASTNISSAASALASDDAKTLTPRQRPPALQRRPMTCLRTSPRRGTSRRRRADDDAHVDRCRMDRQRTTTKRHESASRPTIYCNSFSLSTPQQTTPCLAYN